MTSSMPPREHRGTLILIFGILGIVACMPLGIAAWVMGANDLAAMARGEMDRSGEQLTKVGKILGMVSVALAIIGIILWIFVFGALMAAGAAGAGK